MEAAAWQPGYVMEGGLVNRKRVQRLMQLMGLEAIYPKPNLSKVNPGHKKYPYLLRVMEIIFPDHVWSTDIDFPSLPDHFGWHNIHDSSGDAVRSIQLIEFGLFEYFLQAKVSIEVLIAPPHA